MKRFGLVSVMVGVLLPLSWLAVYYVVPGFSSWWYKGPSWTENVLIAVWPSSLLLMADPEGQSVWLPIASIALNAALYALLGVLLWIGLNRSRIVLVGTAAVVLVGWYSLLSL